MTLEHALAFNLVLLAAIATPGPALLVALQTSLARGTRAGVAVGCGLGLMAATWTGAALIGLEAVFRIFPWAYAAAKILGALYLLYIAVRMWLSARQPVEQRDLPMGHTFRRGILINLFNPKSALFAAAVLVVVFPADMSMLENAAVVVNHVLVEFAFYTVLALAVNTSAVSRGYLRMKHIIDRTAAVVLGALGIRLLLAR